MQQTPGRAHRLAAALACLAAAPPIALGLLPGDAHGAQPADSESRPPATAAPAGGVGLRPAPGLDGEDVLELRRRLETQAAQLEQLSRAVAAQQRQLHSLRQQMGAAVPLDELRGTGGAPDAVPDVAAGSTAGSAATPSMRVPGPMAQATGQPQPTAASSGQQQQPAPQQPAQIFDQPGVLTPRGKMTLEPAFQMGYSSSSRLSVVGYTVIPALNVGLFDVREVKRNTYTTTLSARYGLTNRLELEGRIPYVWREDDTITRPFGLGSGQDNLFGASGRGLGDIELALRYQLNQPTRPNSPYYVGSLRLKTRTGTDPFEVLSDPSLPGTPGGAAGTAGLQRELPTGSGFYALQPAVTWLFPSDPLVLFGSVSYLYNFARSNVVRNTTNGPEQLGEIKPGDIIGFNMGLGLSLNDRASLSLGYDHASIGRTRQNGSFAPLSVRTQLGTLLLGLSYRLDAKRSINVALGVGATRDAPDMTLTVRVPYSLF